MRPQPSSGSALPIVAFLSIAVLMIAQVGIATAGTRAFRSDPGISPPSQQAARSGPASVIVTIVVEGLRIPAVSVELRNVPANIVVGKTTSDAVGQVTFPDVSPGRYLVHTVREGFADPDSPPFNATVGATGTGSVQ